jgi:hypothetical protein
MEDYGTLTLIQLIDLLSDYTSHYSKLYFDESSDKELTDFKKKIIALQEEIRKRKEVSNNKNK